MKIIQVVPYDPNWPIIFAEESKIIQEALGENCLEIHHIGSTSVPGLMAKPKIDMLAVVKDPSQVAAQLTGIGMQDMGEHNIPLHYGFKKRGKVNINLHVYEKGHPAIELNLLFRDYLRNHPEERDQYATLKENLLKDPSSYEKHNAIFTGYNLGKDVFIKQILQAANFNRIYITKCAHYAEWDAAKYFRNEYFFRPHGIDDPYTWTLNSPEHTHLMLYQGAEIIGYAHIQLWPENRAALRMMVVDEAKRNKHFGSQFLNLCEQWLRKLGVKSLHVESRSISIGFYTKNGYKEMLFNDPNGYKSDPQDIAVGKML